ncbi:MAG: mechanosensitive ion channel family protein [Clostridium sp.]
MIEILLYQLQGIKEQLDMFISSELLIIVILLIMLFRKKIVISIRKLAYAVFKLPISKIEERERFNFLSTYILLSGSLLLIKILAKNPIIEPTLFKMFKILSIFILSLTLSTFISPESLVFKKIIEKSEINKNIFLNQFISKLIKVIIYILGIFIIITELGYNINGLAAGLGIGSAIVALAVQDTVKSIISGATIITEKPFVIGDFIELNKYLGTVETITLRNTKVRLLDNTIVNIPNSIITNECVVNYNEIENRRIELKINLPFDVELRKMERILRKIENLLENSTKVLPQTSVVRFEEISKEGLRIYVYCYISESKYERYIAVKEHINFEIMKILDSEKVLPLYSVTQLKGNTTNNKQEEKIYIEI